MANRDLHRCFGGAFDSPQSGFPAHEFQLRLIAREFHLAKKTEEKPPNRGLPKGLGGVFALRDLKTLTKAVDFYNLLLYIELYIH